MLEFKKDIIKEEDLNLSPEEMDIYKKTCDKISVLDTGESFIFSETFPANLEEMTASEHRIFSVFQSTVDRFNYFETMNGHFLKILSKLTDEKDPKKQRMEFMVMKSKMSVELINLLDSESEIIIKLNDALLEFGELDIEPQGIYALYFPADTEGIPEEVKRRFVANGDYKIKTVIPVTKEELYMYFGMMIIELKEDEESKKDNKISNNTVTKLMN